MSRAGYDIGGKCICGGDMFKFPHHTLACNKCGFMVKETEKIKMSDIQEWFDYYKGGDNAR